MIRYAQLNIPVDIASMQQEVMALSAPWNLHFNTMHYEGEWTVLPLRVPGGDSKRIIPDNIHEEEVADTPQMSACPSIQKLIAGFECPVLSVRLLKLKSGAIIKPHKDHELSFEMGEARLHFPVLTNDGVEFYIDDELLRMREGQCWYINANLQHSVANKGDTDRIHLVVDCKVNDWLIILFDQADKKYVPAEAQREEMLKVIESLRMLGTETGERLAKELEGRLG
ncbi:MAG TPA: aspartyl/asparaginyl beta-hydroxylase domain-containing protein [Chitinophagaceae bacterium]